MNIHIFMLLIMAEI